MTRPATNVFPALHINTTELVDEVDRLLVEAAQVKDEFGDVEWSEICISDIQYRLSMIHPENGPSCWVTIGRACPECALPTHLSRMLADTKFSDVLFECEW